MPLSCSWCDMTSSSSGDIPVDIWQNAALNSLEMLATGQRSKCHKSTAHSLPKALSLPLACDRGSSMLQVCAWSDGSLQSVLPEGVHPHEEVNPTPHPDMWLEESVSRDR